MPNSPQVREPDRTRLTFHATLHPRPALELATEQVVLDGQSYTALRLPAEAYGAKFAVSFEDTLAALEQLERMFIEPDGSFVWTSNSATIPAWQVDGVLYDREGRLLFVDLKGTCPEAELDRLLGACGWPATPVVFQIVSAGVFLDDAEFRRYARLCT